MNLAVPLYVPSRGGESENVQELFLPSSGLTGPSRLQLIVPFSLTLEIHQSKLKGYLKISIFGGICLPQAGTLQSQGRIYPHR